MNILINKKRLTILQLVTVKWWNGVASYAVELSIGLKNAGHRIIIIGRPGSPCIEKAKEYGLEVKEELFYDRNNLLNILTLNNIIKTEKIDLVNVHTGEDHFFVTVPKILGLFDTPVIRTRGDVRNPKANILSRLQAKKFTNKFITTTNILKNIYHETFMLSQEKVICIPQGIDPSPYYHLTDKNYARKLLGLSDKRKVISIIARTSPVKGHSDFLKAASLVIKKFPDTIFVIAGKEEEVKYDDLKKQASALKIVPNIKFLGFMSNIKELFSAVDIGVIASRGSEAVSRICLEYMAAAIPVVGTSVNAVNETIRNGDTGLLVNSGDFFELANALMHLLGNEEKAKQMGLNGRHAIENHLNLEQWTKKTEDVYYHVLEET